MLCLLLGEKFDLHRNGEESSESNSSRIFHLCEEKKIKLRTFRFSTAAMNISCQSTSRYFTKIVCSAYRLLSTSTCFFFFFFFFCYELKWKRCVSRDRDVEKSIILIKIRTKRTGACRRSSAPTLS